MPIVPPAARTLCQQSAHRALDMYTGDDAQISDLSCAPRASYCAAGGIYFDRSGHLHGFVVSERHDP